jgi:N,N'-diacetyllegionaminate synthase
LKIGNRVIDLDGSRAFVIAEAGVNHNGDVALAHRLIDVAADAGADAVKFQTFLASKVAVWGGATAPYQLAAGGGTDQRSMLEQLELPPSAWPELSRHAGDRGLVFLSTAFDERSLELLVELGVDALKVPSGELTSIGYLQLHASCGLPCLISTGMATMDEVASAVRVFEQSVRDIALLHCVTAYPTPLEACNLRAITAMRNRFDVAVGWSDHTHGSITAIAARGLGSVIFEKHLTLDRAMTGPDHGASADPNGFAEYVSDIRSVELALGTGVKEPAEVEMENRAVARRSYYASRTIKADERLTESNIEALRPLRGIPASVDIVGRVALRDIPASFPIEWSDLA